jgi:hypothetical protein
MFIGIVMVAVVPAPVVVPPGPVPVVVVCSPTSIVPIMNGWWSQWNVYVPAVLKVQVADHPGAVGVLGTGGAWALPPTVHEVGCGPVPKSTLCVVPPDGYEKLTVPPGAIVTVLPPPAAVKASSLTVNEPLLDRVDVAVALSGSIATSPPITPARHITSSQRLICLPFG